MNSLNNLNLKKLYNNRTFYEYNQDKKDILYTNTYSDIKENSYKNYYYDRLKIIFNKIQSKEKLFENIKLDIEKYDIFIVLLYLYDKNIIDNDSYLKKIFTDDQYEELRNLDINNEKLLFSMIYDKNLAKLYDYFKLKNNNISFTEIFIFHNMFYNIDNFKDEILNLLSFNINQEKINLKKKIIDEKIYSPIEKNN